jgi:hypothetical protein
MFEITSAADAASIAAVESFSASTERPSATSWVS